MVSIPSDSKGLAAPILNRTPQDSYTCSTVPAFSSVRHAHGKRRAEKQTGAQRTPQPGVTMSFILVLLYFRNWQLATDYLPLTTLFSRCCLLFLRRQPHTHVIKAQTYWSTARPLFSGPWL